MRRAGVLFGQDVSVISKGTDPVYHGAVPGPSRGVRKSSGNLTQRRQDKSTKAQRVNLKTKPLSNADKVG